MNERIKWHGSAHIINFETNICFLDTCFDIKNFFLIQILPKILSSRSSAQQQQRSLHRPSDDVHDFIADMVAFIIQVESSGCPSLLLFLSNCNFTKLTYVICTQGSTLSLYHRWIRSLSTKSNEFICPFHWMSVCAGDFVCAKVCLKFVVWLF